MKDPDRTRTVAFPMLEADKPPPDAWLDEELLAGEHEELGTGEHEELGTGEHEPSPAAP